MNRSPQIGSFKSLSLFTLIAVYFLILVGGIVRSTGSGMGCPDWPMCFGKLVPPTDVSELPADYKQHYSEYRSEKNKRFASILDKMGFETAADQILKDESIAYEGDFNVYKTWTEYINRLVGVVIGLLIFATMVTSLRYLGRDNKLVFLSVAVFVLVGFQGWIGSVVVSTNLLPWTITIHMFLALLIVLLLINIAYRARFDDFKAIPISGKRFIRVLILLCITAVAAQIFMGTQVREAIDTVAANLSQQWRETWIDQVGVVFLVHRSFSILLLLLHGLLVVYLFKSGTRGHGLSKAGIILVILVVVEIISGVVMAYFGIPPFLQPLHLLLSTLIFGALYFMFLLSANHDKHLISHSKS